MAMKPIVFAAQSQVSGPAVTLGAIADLSPLPLGLRGRAASLVIALAPHRSDHFKISTRRAAARARALMPALGPWLTDQPDATVGVSVANRRKAPSGFTETCFTVVSPVAAGSFAPIDDFGPAICATAPVRRALRYDARSGAVRAGQDLQPGELVAAAPASLLAHVRPGERLTLAARVGPVKVERSVEALQPAVEARGLFVRAVDGQVFSVAEREIEP
ncbi:MAG: hypothetical protein ACHP84_00955 [Caulobacterales bacterium]